MFLALREILYDKSRFALIIAVITLVGYLAYFLTALAFGLATSYTQGIDKWQASGIILTQEANGSIGRSMFSTDAVEDISAPQKSPLGVSNALAELESSQDVALFGIGFDSFLAPDLTEGRYPEQSNEVVVSDALIENGATLGGELALSQLDDALTIVGITNQATFQTSPIVYLNLDDWRYVSSQVIGMSGMRDQTTINAIVTRGESSEISYDDDKFSWLSLRDFAFELPGYSAQVATFSLMIGSLILIAAFVLTIFIYILTLQKKSMFGILKAEGVPSSYIGRSVLVQTLLLSVIGLGTGAALAIATGYGLGSAVPFMVEPLFFGGIAGLFIVCALIGGIVSVRTVVKIDPVEAIG